MKPILLLSTILLAASSALGNTFYVATTGSDANPGTQAQPWATIGHANAVVGPGDTVHVQPGTYNTAGITTSASGAPGSPVTFISDTRWAAQVVVTGAPDSCWNVAASWVVIDGFDITEGSSGSCRGGLINTSGTNVTFQHNRVHDLQHSSVISNCTTEGGEGIGSFPGTSNLSILANEVFNVGNPNGAQSCTFIHGIYDNSTGDIENNLIFHNAGFGINSHSDSQNIVNNTIFNQNAGGIWITGGTSGHNIINNIIYDVGIGNNSNQAGVNSSYSDDSPSNSAYTDNLIFQSSGSQANNWVVRGSGPGTTGYVNAAPQFVNYTGTQTGNYQLASSSPAVGAGTMNFAPGTDFTGSTRQAPIWMGAYQSGGSGGGGGGSLPAAPTGLTASVQ